MTVTPPSATKALVMIGASFLDEFKGRRCCPEGRPDFLRAADFVKIQDLALAASDSRYAPLYEPNYFQCVPE